DPKVRDAVRNNFYKGELMLQLSKEEEEFVPWEKADGDVFLTFRAPTKIAPPDPKDGGYGGYLQIVVKAKEPAATPKRNPTWDFHSLTFTELALLPPPKGPRQP